MCRPRRSIPSICGSTTSWRWFRGGRPLLVTSGYRTQATNERLRRHGIDAARNSFHLRGRAVDIQLPGIEPRVMARLGLLLGLGGVGVYATFVHLDTGEPRMWQG